MADYQVGQRVSYRNISERNKIRDNLRRQGMDIDNAAGNNFYVVPKGYYRTNTGKFISKNAAFVRKGKEFEAGSDAILGKAFSRAETRSNVSEQSPRDVVFDSRDQPVSKAFEVQSQAERRRTADVSAKYISEKGLYKYRGDTNGSIRDGVSGGLSDRTSSIYLGSSISGQTSSEKIQKPQGSIQARELTFIEKLSRQQDISETSAKRNWNKPIGGVAVVGAFGSGVVKGFGGFVSDLSPINFNTGKLKIPLAEGAKFGFSLVTKPSKTVNLIRADASTRPISFLGEVAGMGATPKVLGKVGGGVKNVYVAAGSKFVAPEKVFDVGVLEGKTTFPMVKSIPESLKEFGKSDKVVTASPQKISGTTAGAGKFGKLGWEDPGIYVTPRGRGSPYFLGVDKPGYAFSLNPLKPLKQSFSLPTVTEFTVKGVRLQPRSVVNTPGFSASKSFFESTGGKSGYAFITKRSEIGLGNLKSQKFRVAGDKVDLLLKEKPFKIKEFGTQELEAVVPLSAKFQYSPKSFFGKVKGFDSYTRFNNKNVPLRSAKVLSEDDVVLPSVKSPLGSRVLSGKRIASESSRLYSSRYYSPFSSLKYLPRYSSRSGGSSFSSRSSGSSFKSSSPKSMLSNLSSGSSKKGSSSFFSGSSFGGSSSKGGSSFFGGSSTGGSYYPSPTSFKVLPPTTTPKNFNFDKGGKRRKSGGVLGFKFKSNYFPSIEAAYFNVKGKGNYDSAARSGLVLRPLRF